MERTGKDLKYRRTLREDGIQFGRRTFLARVRVPEKSKICTVKAMTLNIGGDRIINTLIRQDSLGMEDWGEVSLRGCLEQFVLLDDKPDEDVAQFASRWGKFTSSSEHGLADNHVYEPIKVYRAYAEHMRSLLLLAAHLRQKSVTEEDIDSVRKFGHGKRTTLTQTSEALHSEARQVLSEAVSALLSETKARPKLVFEREDEPELILDATDPLSSETPSPLFVALVFELVGAITSGVYICGQCGKLFTPKEDRAPREDRATYCGEGCRREARLKQKRASAERSRKENSDSAAATNE